jgi:ribosomal protein L6P/L9E
MKKLYIGNLSEIFLGIVNNQQMLIISKNTEDTKYIKVPIDISIKKDKDFLIFYQKGTESTFFSVFFSKLESLLNLKNIIKRKLILKGVGYKISFSDNSKNIVFKLGYSHLIVLSIPEQIFNVSISKNLISMQSYDTTFLGNFLAKIRNLRVPDSYKGKGFLRKNEKLTLKQLKKK